ncbi:hypothetical protein J5N97_026302 [Dioscorea zingiberensis]|uniref:Glycine-rich protein n=1 Tax=Dioscorea zingiberensis TaxID=325984 RepID=A0A9D5H6D1_9LILI|nr:hypothetical protein J5N97_026302 [Dioscorea zingiberensis]
MASSKSVLVFTALLATILFLSVELTEARELAQQTQEKMNKVEEEKTFGFGGGIPGFGRIPPWSGGGYQGYYPGYGGFPGYGGGFPRYGGFPGYGTPGYYGNPGYDTPGYYGNPGYGNPGYNGNP